MDELPGRGSASAAPLATQDAPREGPSTLLLIERFTALLLVAALLAGVLAVLRPFATALLFAAVLAIATWPLRSALLRLRLSRGMAALVLSLAVIGLVGLPALVAAPRLALRIAEGARNFETALASLSAQPPSGLAGLPLIGEKLSRLWGEAARAGGDLRVLLEPYADWIRQSVLTAAQAMADSMLQLLLALVIAAMFWMRGDAVADALRDLAQRLGGFTAVRALESAGGALRSVAYGVVGTAIIQALFMAAGAALAGVPAPGVLGFLVLVLAISQIGQILISVVWGGAAWWLFRHAGDVWGTFMIVWGLILVSASDNVIRPWLIGRGMTMPLTLVVLGVFGGFVSFGFLGLFIGPALIAVAFTLLEAWRAQGPNRPFGS